MLKLGDFIVELDSVQKPNSEDVLKNSVKTYLGFGGVMGATLISREKIILWGVALQLFGLD